MLDKGNILCNFKKNFCMAHVRGGGGLDILNVDSILAKVLNSTNECFNSIEIYKEKDSEKDYTINSIKLQLLTLAKSHNHISHISIHC